MVRKDLHIPPHCWIKMRWRVWTLGNSEHNIHFLWPLCKLLKRIFRHLRGARLLLAFQLHRKSLCVNVLVVYAVVLRRKVKRMAKLSKSSEPSHRQLFDAAAFTLTKQMQWLDQEDWMKAAVCTFILFSVYRVAGTSKARKAARQSVRNGRRETHWRAGTFRAPFGAGTFNMQPFVLYQTKTSTERSCLNHLDLQEFCFQAKSNEKCHGLQSLTAIQINSIQSPLFLMRVNEKLVGQLHTSKRPIAVTNKMPSRASLTTESRWVFLSHWWPESIAEKDVEY